MQQVMCVYCGQPLEEPPGEPYPHVAQGAAIAGPHHSEHDVVQPIQLDPNARWAAIDRRWVRGADGQWHYTGGHAAPAPDATVAMTACAGEAGPIEIEPGSPQLAEPPEGDEVCAICRAAAESQPSG